MSQHMEALAKANEIRLGRAQIKREINAGEMSVIEVLEKKPNVCDSMTLMELLSSQDRWGRGRTLKFLQRFKPLSESKELCKLTDRQRTAILEALNTLSEVRKNKRR